MKYTISIKELFSYGWGKTKDHMWFVVGVTFVAFFITSVAQALLDNKNDAGFASFIIQIGLMALNVLLSIGGLSIFLKLSKGETAEFKDLFAHYYLLWKFFLTQLVVNVIVLVGFLLLIVPGFVWAMKYMFAPLIVVDKQVRPIEALKQSSRMTYGYKWDLFRLSVVVCLLNLAGFLVVGIGLLITIPVSIFVFVYVYQKLSPQAETTLSTSTISTE